MQGCILLWPEASVFLESFGKFPIQGKDGTQERWLLRMVPGSYPKCGLISRGPLCGGTFGGPHMSCRKPGSFSVGACLPVGEGRQDR